MNQTLLLWGGFTLFIVAMLALDLGVFQRRPHIISMKEAMTWFGVWTALALVFNVGIFIFHERGAEAALEFFTGYLVEKSLSIDNIFVFILLFGYFRVPQLYQHKVLFWGIVGAIVLRVMFILGGLALMERFHWMIYVFGGFLLFSGISMMCRKDRQTDPENNWVIRTFRRFFAVSERYDGNRFFTRIDGRLVATPLFVVLLAVESSDIIFAVDSIPAIFAITQDPFLVFTSNVFAMLGLRTLYFAVAGFMRMFHFLHYGFASIIVILGVKMLISEFYKVPVAVSLVLILVLLLVCVIISLLRPRRDDLKQMFERSEKLGLLPFRRLLLIENIVDLGDLTVKDSMRHRSGVRCIRLDIPWEANLAVLRESRFSRYPVQRADEETPIGVIHLKDLALMEDRGNPSPEALKTMVRTCVTLGEEMSLDAALTQLQRGQHHIALVTGRDGEWTGIITLEDVLEELVGKIGDEFDSARDPKGISLADAISRERIVFEVEATTLDAAIAEVIRRIPPGELPSAPRKIIDAIYRREATMSTYLGQGLALPHARLPDIDKPYLIFARSEIGIPIVGTDERIELMFILLTPERMARIQPRLLADIVGLVESEYVTERLKKAEEPEEVIEAIREGQQVVLD